MTAVSALVLAAGSGARYGEPKQFSELTPGVRLVDAAVATASAVTDVVVVVLPAGHTWDGPEVHAAVVGGDSRLDSVRAGLSALPQDRPIVVVHDAAHPLAPLETFGQVIAAVEGGAEAAVPLLPVTDVVKRRDDHGLLSTVGRDDLGLAQVPMAFSTPALVTAHTEHPGPGAAYWEDSMLIEAVGGTVVAVPGSARNIHVVTPADLEIARALAGAGGV